MNQYMKNINFIVHVFILILGLNQNQIFLILTQMKSLVCLEKLELHYKRQHQHQIL